MPRRKRTRTHESSSESSSSSDSSTDTGKRDKFPLFPRIYLYRRIYSQHLSLFLFTGQFLLFLVTVPVKIYSGSPAKGKAADSIGSIELDISSCSLEDIQRDIVSSLNNKRKQLGLKKIPRSQPVDIWFTYSSYPKVELNKSTKTRFFSKLKSKNVSSINLRISLHNMEKYIKTPIGPLTKKQRAKIGDLRSGINLTKALQANQELFNGISPENMVLKAGTANFLDSTTSALRNISQVSQLPALKIQLSQQLAKTFATAAEIAKLSENSVIEQEEKLCSFRISVRQAFDIFENSFNFPTHENSSDEEEKTESDSDLSS